ncbi:MAG: hypothetical protein QM784_33495 [Polyangiaceae bacterium]
MSTVAIGCTSATSSVEDFADDPQSTDVRSDQSSPVTKDEATTAGEDMANSEIATTTAAATQSPYPCNGSTTGYDAIAIKSGSTWKVTRSGKNVYSGSDMAAAMSAAMNSLTANRTAKQSVLVQGSGVYPAGTRFTIPSYTVLNVCGTINVTGTASGDYAPIYSRDRKNIEIPNVKITGTPNYGMFFRNVSDLKLGNLDLRHTTGIGVRVDNNAGSVKVTDLIHRLRVRQRDEESRRRDLRGRSRHHRHRRGQERRRMRSLVEQYDERQRQLGLLCRLRQRHGLCRFPDRQRRGQDRQRLARREHSREQGLRARRWARIFSVSGSGGLTIDEIDVADTGNNPILLQNCINTTIAAKSGKISGGAVVLSNDTTNTNSGKFEASRNVTLKNLVLSNGATVSEAWCQLGDRKNRATNITGGTVKMCFK